MADDRLPSPTAWTDLKQGLKRVAPSKNQSTSSHQVPADKGTDSNSNQISPVPGEPEEEACLEHCQNESYHWCEEDDLTASDAANTSTEKTLASSVEADHHSAEYVELAKKVDTSLAHIDMEDFKSADLFQSEQIQTLLIEYRQCNNRTASRSQSPLSQDDGSLTDFGGSLCKSGPLFSPQRLITAAEGKGAGGACTSDFSTDSLNMMEHDECWLLQEEADGASQLLCRTNMTNYTLAWSSASGGTDQDIEFNEPGTSSSGSEQSRDWSSSGSGGRVPPPIPPWPTGPRQGSTATWKTLNEDQSGTLQCWISHSNSPCQPASTKKTSPVVHRKLYSESSANDKNIKGEQNRTEVIKIQSKSDKRTKSDDSNPTLSDMDNGNGKASKESSNRSRIRPVFTKGEQKAVTPPASAVSNGLSLLQIYMRQRSQTSMERDKKSAEEVIASGGGEGWVEDYPSSADEKLGLESISSSLADEEEEEEEERGDEGDDDVSDDGNDPGVCENARSLTLTDVSDIEQTSIQIDAVPFNVTGQTQQQHSPSTASSSLDKLIAKIKPFELGLSPASIEEHWNFESRLNRAAHDKGCQVAINPASSATQEESTCTEPIKPEAYVIFPSYSLPDLSFLKKHDYTWIGDVFLSPQKVEPTKIPPQPPQRNFDDLKKHQLGHIKDWESLKILLPEEIRHHISRAQPTRQINKPRPKSCDHSVVEREARNKPGAQRPLSYRGSPLTSPSSEVGPALPAVPQSPKSPTEKGGPPPLPKRTASLPQSTAGVRLRRQNVPKQGPPLRKADDPQPSPYGYAIRKTVSFGEHLSGGFLKMGQASHRRPLSVSNWSGDESFDIDSKKEDPFVSVNLESKKRLVQNVSLAAAQLCKTMNQALGANNVGQANSVARCISGQLSPAIYQLLSDGLMPNVNTFFGQVTNSVWRVVEASVKKSPMLPWIEELVFCLNSEESLPEGPVRFGVFINELVNMGGLDWWLDNLSTKETILRRHYAPNGFLYLCHTSTRSLMEELRTSLRPLSSLPFDHLSTKKVEGPAKPATAPSPPASPSKSPVKTILKSPVRSHSVKTQRPLSYVQNSPTRTSPKPQYRRTQSQHSGLSPKKVPPQQQERSETKVEEFSSLKQKWESLCRNKKPAENVSTNAKATPAVSPRPPPPVDASKSKIPRPVFRPSK